MNTVSSSRRAALRVCGLMAAGALTLFLMAVTGAGQEKPPAQKPSLKTLTATPAKAAAQSPATATYGMAQVSRVVVPDVRGRTPGVAQEILNRAGLTFGTMQQGAGPGTAGTISRQSPEQGSVAIRGTAVNVEVVATPQAPKPSHQDTEFSRPVPLVVGRAPEQAQMILGRAGLVLGNQSAGPGNGHEGTIYAQNPQPGQLVKAGSRVDVQVVQASQPPSHTQKAEPTLVIVPELRKQTLPSAQQMLAKSGLQTGSVRTGGTSAPAGTIYAQQPQAGARVRAETPVDLFVAEAPKVTVVAVPDVRNRNANNAAAILQQSRLRLGEQTREESDNNVGLIASQSPQPGTRVEAGSTVNVVVAVAIPRVTVPNLVSLEEGIAVADLSRDRLQMGSLTQTDSDQISGTVLAQSPAAGAQVPRGSSVSLTVSRQIPRTLTVMADEPSAEAGAVVQFHAHLDPEGAGFQYQFVFGDGKHSGWVSGSTVEHAYEAPGSYVVKAVASHGTTSVESGSVGITAKEIDFMVALTATPKSVGTGELVDFSARSNREDIRPDYQFEFADGTQSNWSSEAAVQHRYDHRGTYLTKVRARVGKGRIVESATQNVEIGKISVALVGLIAVGLTGIGTGGVLYYGWKQFLRLVRAVPRMDVGEQRLQTRNNAGAGAGEGARLRMVWPRGEALVEWAHGHGPRKVEGHD